MSEKEYNKAVLSAILVHTFVTKCLLIKKDGTKEPIFIRGVRTPKYGSLAVPAKCFEDGTFDLRKNGNYKTVLGQLEFDEETSKKHSILISNIIASCFN